MYWFHNYFKYTFLEKGMTVVRSPLEVLALIKSCNDTNNENMPKAIQFDNNLVKENCGTPLLQFSQKKPTKILKDISSKRKCTTNVHVYPQVSEINNQQEIKISNNQIVSIQTNSLKIKKLVLSQVKYYLFINYNFLF